jgi:hypothetical protein
MLISITQPQCEPNLLTVIQEAWTGKPPNITNISLLTSRYIINGGLFRPSQPGRDATSPRTEHLLTGSVVPPTWTGYPRALKLGKRLPRSAHCCKPSPYRQRQSIIHTEITPPIRSYILVKVHASPPPEGAKTLPSVRSPMKEGEITVMAHRPTQDIPHDNHNAGPPPQDTKSHGTPPPSLRKNKKQLTLILRSLH